jgi:hypothetical protein
MKTAILASVLATATAFAPAQQTRSSSTALNAFADKPGALPPTGYFDPLGLATSEASFDFYRSVELKHGRVAMLAVIGYVVPEFFRFNYSFDLEGTVTTKTIGNGVAALYDIPALGWAQMFFAIGAVDYYGFLGNFEIVSAFIYWLSLPRLVVCF